VARALARRLGLPSDAAAEVLQLVPGGPAERAGLRTGDRVVAFGGSAVSSIDDLHRAVTDWPLGRPAPLCVVRGEARLELEVVPTDAPRPGRRPSRS
jgi:S1-C subfamily serine protease